MNDQPRRDPRPRIRNALAHEPAAPASAGAAGLAPRKSQHRHHGRPLRQELGEVYGETFRLPTMEEARKKLAELAEASGWTTIGALDQPLCHELLAEVASDRVAWAGTLGEKGTVPICAKQPSGPSRQMGAVPLSPLGTPQTMAELSLGVVQADFLLPTPVRR